MQCCLGAGHARRWKKDRFGALVEIWDGGVCWWGVSRSERGSVYELGVWFGVQVLGLWYWEVFRVGRAWGN